MKEIVFATNNLHKLEEIQHIVKDKIKILSLKDINCIEELEETGDTLEANALQKAMYVFEHYHYDCFADDTGLEIEALDGRPGVYSARYANLSSKFKVQSSMNKKAVSFEDNMRKVLEEMDGKTNRKACFRTVICLVSSLKSQVYSHNKFISKGAHEDASLSSSFNFEGRVDGIIITEKRGTNGFGYDPIFMPDGYNLTFAEMTSAQKNSLSHRYFAIDNLLKSGKLI